MRFPEPFVDLHCHLLPGLDDGPGSWEESLAMARMAVADGIGIAVVTPHQLGSFWRNDASLIRQKVEQLQDRLDEHEIPLRVLAGADVRIEPELVGRLCRGEVMSLADGGRYVLLELPHEMYVPLDHLLAELAAAGYVGILSHPERNRGLLARPELVSPLVASGCLMQLTADSLLGAFGRRSQRLSEQMLRRGLAHFVSSDAHDTARRRPLLSAAFARIAELTDLETALALCCRNPARVVAGSPVSLYREGQPRQSAGWFGWLKRRKAG